MSELDTLRADVERALLARGGRQRGDELRFLCLVHRDRRPSADFNPSKGVWLCRSCGAGGGVKDLATRLGLATGTQQGPPRGRLSWRAALEQPFIARARRAAARLAPYEDLFVVSDFIRESRRAIREARQEASVRGDVDSIWAVLAAVAADERALSRIESEVAVAMAGIR